MKIGITCYPTFGGSGILATELGKILAHRGHEVHFITSAMPYRIQLNYQKGVYFHQVESNTYPLFEENSLYALALASKLKEVFVEESLDVLHMHYALPHAISAFLTSKMLSPIKVPIVTTLHGTDVTIVGQEKSLYDITRLGINESTVVTVVSEYLKAEVERVFAPEIEVKTIYNFVDTHLFKSKPVDPLRMGLAQEDEIVFLHISNFREVKRVPDVIETFYGVQKQIKSILVLVGEGPVLADAKAQVQALGISQRVKFLGKQEDVVTILKCADIFLFFSDTESFGLAALEAMACEVPVVGSRSGGMVEVLEDGIQGYLCEVGDISALIEKSLRLAKSKELRLKMGQAGRRRALGKFNPSVIVPLYEQVYIEAMNNC